jgi:hypothetical protein
MLYFIHESYHCLILSKIRFTLESHLYHTDADTMQIEMSTQPESLSKLLVRSLRLYRATFLRVFYLGLLLSVIAFIPRLMTFVIGENYLITLPINSPKRLWFIIIDLISIALFTAILWRMRCKSLNIHEGILTDFKVAIKKLPFIFMAGVIQSFIIMVIYLSIFMLFFFLHKQPNLISSAAFFFIAASMSIIQALIAIYLFIAFYFYLPLILTENKRVFAALKESIHLVWGNWWRTFKLQIIPWLVYLACLFIIRDIIHINVHIYFFRALEEITLPGVILHIFLFALFIPWIAATQLVQLRDLELRKKMLPSQ